MFMEGKKIIEKNAAVLPQNALVLLHVVFILETL
jgi:hypothetical protein